MSKEKSPKEELDLPKDPAICELAAIEFVSNLIKDTDLKEEIDFKKLKTSYMNGQATADTIFDALAKQAKNEDIKKDILMYKKWAKCDYSDYTEPTE